MNWWGWVLVAVPWFVLGWRLTGMVRDAWRESADVELCRIKLSNRSELVVRGPEGTPMDVVERSIRAAGYAIVDATVLEPGPRTGGFIPTEHQHDRRGPDDGD